MHEVPCLVMNPGETRLRWNPRYSNPFFAGLVVIAGEFHPIPFRTRPLKPPAPMVLRVNTRESRSPPGLQRTDYKHPAITPKRKPRARNRTGLLVFLAYARRAWNFRRACSHAKLGRITAKAAPRRNR